MRAQHCIRGARRATEPGLAARALDLQDCEATHSRLRHNPLTLTQDPESGCASVSQSVSPCDNISTGFRDMLGCWLGWRAQIDAAEEAGRLGRHSRLPRARSQPAAPPSLVAGCHHAQHPVTGAISPPSTQPATSRLPSTLDSHRAQRTIANHHHPNPKQTSQPSHSQSICLSFHLFVLSYGSVCFVKPSSCSRQSWDVLYFGRQQETAQIQVSARR